MRGVLEDVLACEAPVAPAEITHLVKSLEIKRSRDRVLLSKVSHPTLLSAVTHGFQELAMVARPVLTEVLQDVGERGLGHRNLQQVVAHGDLLMSISGYLQIEISLTMLSLAPDSPRNDKGSSLTPSYMTPFGNMDCEVMPKMKVRKLV
jgi:hypothetical protein